MTIAVVQEMLKPEILQAFDVVVKLKPLSPMSDDEFFDFCRANSEMRIEQTAEGEIILMPPTGFETSEKNAELTSQLRIWAKKDGRGRTTDSNGEFVLPNGAKRAPDAAWILKEKVAQIPVQEHDKFLPLCPDFVVELTSPSDTLKDVQEKMHEYIENGAQLGWLIHPKTKQVFVYRPNSAVEVLNSPETVSGEPLLTGFELDLREIW